jgi:hypothetical protein
MVSIVVRRPTLAFARFGAVIPFGHLASSLGGET